MIEVTCPYCKGTGKIEKPIDEATPLELAESAHAEACELWRKYDDMASLVAMLYALKEKLKKEIARR
ncbi:MAG: hypothetical protein DRN26_00605 [Thermoplasmata archaeon]|nr:MAG: hypothetical protein DRN26_00605 [Thermoplasmata archaeon]